MVLRDSFISNDKVKIVMLTCICPGMSSANHTLNSLRYAERLKEKSQGGQGASGSKGLKGLSRDQVNEELKLFLEKHGKELPVDDDPNDLPQKQTGALNFYNDNRMDEIMEGNDADDLINDDGDDDLLMQQDIEDDMAAFIVQPKSHNTQYPKRSPNAAANNQRKGQPSSNLTNISNTAH